MLKTFLPKAFKSEKSPSNKGYFPLEPWIQVQIGALTPANGMIVYNTNDNEFQGYQNGGWVTFDTTPIV